MIVTFFLELLLSLVTNLFSLFPFPNLDFSAINTLKQITDFGVYILGTSLLDAYFACILFWFSIQFFINLVRFLLSLIP